MKKTSDMQYGHALGKERKKGNLTVKNQLSSGLARLYEPDFIQSVLRAGTTDIAFVFMKTEGIYI